MARVMRFLGVCWCPDILRGRARNSYDVSAGSGEEVALADARRCTYAGHAGQAVRVAAGPGGDRIVSSTGDRGAARATVRDYARPAVRGEALRAHVGRRDFG